jgi:MarR family transcriptional regulator, organic hydroperoxide resistance regulator
LYAVANKSVAEQFDVLYGRLWRAYMKPDANDLSQHERQLLHHVPPAGGIPLGDVATHLGIPKSSASEQVKSLERRGFLRRRRDLQDERRLSIVLTAKGQARVAADSVLDLDRLAAALKKLSSRERAALLAGLERLTVVAPKVSSSGPVFSAARFEPAASQRGRLRRRGPSQGSL